MKDDRQSNPNDFADPFQMDPIKFYPETDSASDIIKQRPSSSDSDSTQRMQSKQTPPIGFRGYVCILVLFLINLLNYMDRYTVAGVLTSIQHFFDINDAQAGLLQTIFIVFFMVFAPLCGFLGDRYNRKWIMTAGIAVWVIAVFASSFVPANMFVLFVILRGIVGVGEASYSTIAPTIIADMFVSSVRSRVLMFFYFAIPVGSGVGYMVGSTLASAFGGWEWGVRFTPILGVVCLILIIFIIEEPKRGQAELAINQKSETSLVSTSYLKDMSALCKIPTYVSSVFAYTAVVFVTGTLSWWGPTAISHSFAIRENKNSTSELSNSEKD
ncbi:unnamed protein product, partial [Anisakis simplex]|uniref:MFS domain-containing protein n=2 Tax=Anisakis simplex TaxID=6269 RepID=A0A0M3KDZ5_ANISI